MRGRFNSSITRVRPVFSELVRRDATGHTWLPQLLELTPGRERIPTNMRIQPGGLLPELLQKRLYSDKVLGQIELLGCFERRVPPPTAFLRWLILHPDQMTWPANAGTSVEALRRRRELCGGGQELRAAQQRDALTELEQRGASGSDKKWWAFEGFTEVDCWLETEDLVLLVEGKRREALSTATAWYPARNQLVRNLEVADEHADGKAAFVLLAVEERAPELTREALVASTPHLSDLEQERLSERYLGQVTWHAIVESLGLPADVLMETSR